MSGGREHAIDPFSTLVVKCSRGVTRLTANKTSLSTIVARLGHEIAIELEEFTHKQVNTEDHSAIRRCL